MMNWKCQKSTLALVLMFFWATVACVSAGVVEDAEAELKKLKKTGSAVRTSAPSSEFEAPSFPGSEPQTNSEREKSARPHSRETRGKASGKSVGVVNLGQEKPELQDSSPRRSGRVERDRLYSIFGILVLLALIAAGAVFSKDGFKES